MKRRLATYILALLALVPVRAFGDEGEVIEKQLAEIGTIHNEEIVVVQRKYTKKDWRHEFSPVQFGGVPFGTVRRTLMGGASYSLHFNDNWAWEALNFSYTKTFFSSFTDDINNNKEGAQAKIKPDFQKLLYFLTTGIQWTPIYGKMSTFSRWIAYIEPYIGLGVGVAKTEASSYVTFYPAIGIRAFFREWFSMKFEFRDYLYTEKFNTRTNPPVATSALRNNYAVMLSLSFWLPKMPL
jgi:outer membrane beta-barrel protein